MQSTVGSCTQGGRTSRAGYALLCWSGVKRLGRGRTLVLSPGAGRALLRALGSHTLVPVSIPGSPNRVATPKFPAQSRHQTQVTTQCLWGRVVTSRLGHDTQTTGPCLDIKLVSRHNLSSAMSRHQNCKPCSDTCKPCHDTLTTSFVMT